MADKQDRCLPYPEIVSPGKRYTIKFSDLPRVSEVKREMFIDPRRPSTTLHEMAHVKWSPRKPPGAYDSVDPEYLMAVEDARIQWLLKRKAKLSVDWDKEHMQDVMLTAIALKNQPRELELALAAFGSNAQRAHQDLLSDVFVETYENAVKRIKRATSFQTALKIARELTAKFPRPPEPEKKKEKCRGKTSPQKCDPNSEYKYGMELSGRMEILEPELTETVVRKTKKSYKRHRLATGEGSSLTHAHRWAIDKRIFCRTKKELIEEPWQGSILIDASGSMGIDEQELRELVKITAGQSVVATYSGAGGEGVLNIVAKEGKMVEEILNYGGGNVVDLPALLWLAKQPEPRIWVSDGGVTGIDDSPTREIKDACFEIRDNNRIEQIGDVQDAIEQMKERK